MSDTSDKKCEYISPDGTSCGKVLRVAKQNYCQAHAPHNYKLNPCKWKGCAHKCRKEFCNVHNPATMQKKNEKARAARKVIVQPTPQPV